MFVSKSEGQSARKGRNILDKPVASAATVIILLQLHKLEFTKRLKDVLKILLSDAEMDVAHIKSVEGDGVGVVARRLGVANLAILLSFGGLNDDGNT